MTHKIWKKNELCLSFGKTGYCERGVCDLVAPQLIMNKMTEAVESLKPYYQEDMRKRSELPSKKARDVAQVGLYKNFVVM